MILLTKDEKMYLVNCNGNREEISEEERNYYLDTIVNLEDGFTLRNFLNIVDKMLIKLDRFVWINPTDYEVEVDGEYISVTPLYNLNIKNNGVHIIDKSHVLLQLETIEGPIYIFDYMIPKLLDIELRIDRDMIEYQDATFFMPEELTLRELIYAIVDGVIDSGAD